MLNKKHQKTPKKNQKQPKKKPQKKTLQGLAFVNIPLKSCVKVQWSKLLEAITFKVNDG